MKVVFDEFFLMKLTTFILILMNPYLAVEMPNEFTTVVGFRLWTIVPPNLKSCASSSYAPWSCLVGLQLRRVWMSSSL